MYKKKRLRSKSVKVERVRVKAARSELAEDLAVFKERANEPTRSFESFVRELERRGKL
jgi:hypothetical protein